MQYKTELYFDTKHAETDRRRLITREMDMTRSPNILWICTDQQRWDTISALGNQHINTPNIDRLCQRGIAFTRAYCQSTVCTPSRASFMTGRYPATTHVFRNDAGPYPSSETTAASIFKDLGYQTGLIGKLHLSNAKWTERRPTDDGYIEFYRSQSGGRRPEHDNDDYAAWLRNQGVDIADLRDETATILGNGIPAALHQNRWMGDVATDFIERHSDAPWFLSVHPYDPHHPLDPPGEFHSRHDYRTLPHAIFAEHELAYQEAFPAVDQQRPIPIAPDGRCNHPGGPNDHPFIQENPVYEAPLPYDSRKLKAAYYAKIEHVDHEIGRILDALEHTGQLSDTIIIFHSDHGEMLGDHGLLYKGCRFYDALVRVPLVISWPGHLPERQQRDELVELVDVLPTLLDLAGLPARNEIQGESLRPLFEGGHYGKQAVVSHFYDGLDMWDGTHATMTYDGRYKLVLYHNHDELTELFDLYEDPNEFHNVWDDTSPAERNILLRNHIDTVLATVWAGTLRLAQSDFM